MRGPRRRGLIALESLETIRAKAAVNRRGSRRSVRVGRRDRVLTDLAEHIGPDSRFVHYGMTSSDFLDTSSPPDPRRGGSCRRDSSPAPRAVRRAREFSARRDRRPTACSGSHHVRLKLLVYAGRCGAGRSLARALEEAAVVQISGASVRLASAARVAGGVPPARIGFGRLRRRWSRATATRLHRARAVRVELREDRRRAAPSRAHRGSRVQEVFSSRQKALRDAHKRTPWRLENVSGLARVIRLRLSASRPGAVALARHHHSLSSA